MVTGISGFLFLLPVGWLSCILTGICQYQTNYQIYWHKPSIHSLSFKFLAHLSEVCLLFHSIIYLCPISFFLDHSCKRFISDIQRPEIFRNSTKSINVPNHWHLLWSSYFYPRIFNWSTKLLLGLLLRNVYSGP